MFKYYFKNMNNIDYIALFLVPDAQAELMRYIKIHYRDKNHEYPNHLLEHITVWRNGDHEAFRESFIKRIESRDILTTVCLSEIGWSEDAFAFKISQKHGFFTQKIFAEYPEEQQYELVIGTRVGIKETRSRYIRHWEPIEPIKIQCVLGIKYKES